MTLVCSKGEYRICFLFHRWMIIVYGSNGRVMFKASHSSSCLSFSSPPSLSP